MFKIAFVLLSTTEEVEVGLRNDGVEDGFTNVTVAGVDTSNFTLLPTINDDLAGLVVVKVPCIPELKEASWLDVSTRTEGITCEPMEDDVLRRLLWMEDVMRIFSEVVSFLVEVDKGSSMLLTGKGDELIKATVEGVKECKEEDSRLIDIFTLDFETLAVISYEVEVIV